MLQQVRLIVLSICLVAAYVSKSQQYQQDARLWLYLKVDKKITSKLKAQFILQNRFDNNVTQYSQVNGNIELNYKIKKAFRLTSGYVFGKVKRFDGNYNTRHQAYLGFNYRYKFRRFEFQYRNLIQWQAKNIYSSEKGKTITAYERNKLTITYTINKQWECYFAQEFNSPFKRFLELPVNRYRSFIGGQYHLSKQSYVEGYFMLQTKFNFKSNATRDFVYGLTYSYSF